MRIEAKPTESRCARCDTAFICGMLAGQELCWCATLAALRPVPGQSCLCRKCLETALKARAS